MSLFILQETRAQDLVTPPLRALTCKVTSLISFPKEDKDKKVVIPHEVLHHCAIQNSPLEHCSYETEIVFEFDKVFLQAQLYIADEIYSLKSTTETDDGGTLLFLGVSYDHQFANSSFETTYTKYFYINRYSGLLWGEETMDNERNRYFKRTSSGYCQSKGVRRLF